MKKWGIIMVGAITLVASAVSVTEGEADPLDDPGYPEFPYIEPLAFEDVLPVPLEDQAWNDEECDWAEEGDYGLEAEWGDCYEAGSTRTYLVCDYDAWGSGTQYVVVGKTDGQDRVMMCYSTDATNWYGAGYVDRGGNTTLKVYGDTTSDQIRLQRLAYDYGNGCDYDDWYDSADIAYLYMYGMSGNDRIWGSDNGDTYLNAEYVVGYGGDDTIYLQYTSPNQPQAYGGDGDDDIYGTNQGDYIYGGDGDDTIIAGDGADTIGGGDDWDFIKGEDGADQIWGGPGTEHIWGGDDEDIIYGEEGGEMIWGGYGGDYLIGGPGEEWCYGEAQIDWCECNHTVDCEEP